MVIDLKQPGDLNRNIRKFCYVIFSYTYVTEKALLSVKVSATSHTPIRGSITGDFSMLFLNSGVYAIKKKK